MKNPGYLLTRASPKLAQTEILFCSEDANVQSKVIFNSFIADAFKKAF
jgi:hypothetical protein